MAASNLGAQAHFLSLVKEDRSAALSYARTYLMGHCISRHVAWAVFALFSAPEGYQPLPKDIASWLSCHGVSLDSCSNYGITLSDIVEASTASKETTRWVHQLNWARLAISLRADLSNGESRLAPRRKDMFPVMIQKVIEATWLLHDLNADVALEELQLHFDTHDYVCTFTSTGGSAALAPPAPLTEAFRLDHVGLAVEPVVLPPTVWEQTPGAKRSRRRGGRRHRKAKAKAAASGGAAAGAGGN